MSFFGDFLNLVLIKSQRTLSSVRAYNLFGGGNINVILSKERYTVNISFSVSEKLSYSVVFTAFYFIKMSSEKLENDYLDVSKSQYYEVSPNDNEISSTSSHIENVYMSALTWKMST